jgi:hypothetical protein
MHSDMVLSATSELLDELGLVNSAAALVAERKRIVVKLVRLQPSAYRGFALLMRSSGPD